MMILDVDLGNTSLKWRLLGSERSISVEPNADEVARIAERCQGVSRIRLGSVADRELTANVSVWLATGLQVVPEICEVRRVCGGFETAYEDERRLGVDRWLAALAAWHRFANACIVVDAGTAFTVDVVTTSGRHCGGYIVPGYRSMLDTLWRSTGAVRPDPVDRVSEVAPGLNTGEAVNRGVVQMYLGLIDRTIAGMDETPTLVLTGGDASLLLPHLAGAHCCPDLVLDGLNIACPR